MRLSKLTAVGRHKCGRVPGLYLQISKSGARSFVLRWSRDGKEHMLGLGAASIVTLADAEKRAHKAWQIILEGGNPISDRRAKQPATTTKQITFDEVAARYVAAHRPSWSAKHAQQVPSLLARYVSPVIGRVPVADLNESHVLEVVEPLWATQTETGARLLRRMAAVFNYAEASKLRSGLNPARWKGAMQQAEFNLAACVWTVPVMSASHSNGCAGFGFIVPSPVY